MSNRLPKILHIGGSHSVHVADLVKELDALGYAQCVLSYNKTSLVPHHVPVYYYPYNKYYPDKVLPNDDVNLTRCIHKMLAVEKPDVIHGNFLIFCCVAIGAVQDMSRLPTILSPWSSRAWTANKTLRNRIGKCIARSRYFLLDQKWIFNEFKKSYPAVLKDNMYRHWRFPLYLQAHHDAKAEQKDVSAPKILSARVMQPLCHQDLLVRALPAVFEKYPNASATLIVGQSASQGRKYFAQMVDLAKSLGIHNRCLFVNRSLTQQEFSDMLKNHNIVYSISDSDFGGGSQSAYQSAYAGNITIVKKNPYLGENQLVGGKNVLEVDVTQASISQQLMYASDNIRVLCEEFFQNNRGLRTLSVEYTVPELTKLYAGAVPK